MLIKCLPYNSRGTVSIEAVTPVSITPTGNRALAPYPPGKVRVNDLAFPDGATLVGDVTLTWAHRIRTAQTKRAVVSQDADSTTGTLEGTYTLEVLIDGAVKRTVTGLTGTSYVYTLANRTADDADLGKPVRFRITPVKDALSGTARTTDAFVMSA